eukprot:1897667-Amphidinium_carterae.1
MPWHALRELCQDLGPWLAGRFVATHVGGLLRGGFTLCCVYLTTGLVEQDALAQLEELVRLMRSLTGPYILMGDFQHTPEQMERWGFPQAIGGQTVAPSLPTCTSATGARTIDYFVIARELMPL